MGERMYAEFECRWPSDYPNPADEKATDDWLELQHQLDPLTRNEFIQARIDVVEAIRGEYAPDDPDGAWENWEFGEVAPGIIRLAFNDPEANYGTAHFTELTANCRLAGIAYRLSDEGKFEMPGTSEEWMPGMDAPSEHALINGGSTGLEEVDVKALIANHSTYESLVVALLAEFAPLDIFA